jgi:hypothetical protein
MVDQALQPRLAVDVMDYEANEAIRIRTTLDEFEIEVRAENIEGIENAFLMLLDARTKVRALKEQHRLVLLAQEGRKKASPFWEEGAEGKRVVGTDDKAAVIMLSLLDVYPECKGTSQIAEETDNTAPTASKYLSGAPCDQGSCFEKSGVEWRPSSQGISYMSEWFDEGHT